MADITPMEPPIDSFVASIEQLGMEDKGMGRGELLASLQTHTPPETPELPHLPTIAGNIGNDSPLFPDSPPRDRSRSLSPLLPTAYNVPEGRRQQELLDLNQHDQSNERRRGHSATYPDILGIKNAQDALDFHRSCVEEQRRWRKGLVLPVPAYTFQGPYRDVTSTQQLSRLNKSSGISKPRVIPPRPAPKPVVATAAITTPPRKVSASKKRVAKPKAASEGPSETGSGQKKHTRAAPTKNVTVQEWFEIEDFTPPLSTLDGQTYEVKWDGAQKDISGEKDVQHLHEVERRWATRLRLDPKQYLATKRLIFRERLAYLRQGKTFTKTAAQGAASLDVNKLSRLHMAFDAVGWFDEKWLQQYL